LEDVGAVVQPEAEDLAGRGNERRMVEGVDGVLDAGERERRRALGRGEQGADVGCVELARDAITVDEDGARAAGRADRREAHGASGRRGRRRRCGACRRARRGWRTWWPSCGWPRRSSRRRTSPRRAGRPRWWPS